MGRGFDQTREKDPGLSGLTKNPVKGSCCASVTVFAGLQRAADGALVKYRLDDLSEIVISSEMHGGIGDIWRGYGKRRKTRGVDQQGVGVRREYFGSAKLGSSRPLSGEAAF